MTHALRAAYRTAIWAAQACYYYIMCVRCSVADLVEVMSSCGLPVCDVDDANSESTDVVSTELVSPHQVKHTHSHTHIHRAQHISQC